MDIVFVVGRVTKDAEVKTTSSGKAIVKFSIACDRKDKKVAFYNLDFWGERASKLAGYIKKGTCVSVVAKPEDYQGTDGKTYTSYQVLDFGFAGGSSSSSKQESDIEEDDFAKVIQEEFGGKEKPTDSAQIYDDSIPF